MSTEHVFFMTLAVFCIAWLYSSVGHAGASGYIAVMTLFGMTPAIIKPTALVLNIAVATIASYQFRKHFRWALFWPFGLVSIPCAFMGGYVNLPTHIFRMLIGVVLLVAAVRFFIRPAENAEVHPPTLKASLVTGGGLGLLAGLTGTGGGIFLTPIMLLLRWAGTKTVAATSAVFILVNSISGLAGNLSSTKDLPFVAAPLLIAAVTGGTLGSYLGSNRFAVETIKRVLASVLAIAGGKLLLT